MATKTTTLALNDELDIYFTENMTVRITHLLDDAGRHSMIVEAIAGPGTTVYDSKNNIVPRIRETH